MSIIVEQISILSNCIIFLFYQFYNLVFLLPLQNGTSDHLDMCILNLFSLVFQGDIFLFYLLLVYVNNCRTKIICSPICCIF
jgi:hypothetical protein